MAVMFILCLTVLTILSITVGTLVPSSVSVKLHLKDGRTDEETRRGIN